MRQFGLCVLLCGALLGCPTDDESDGARPDLITNAGDAAADTVGAADTAPEIAEMTDAPDAPDPGDPLPDGETVGGEETATPDTEDAGDDGQSPDVCEPQTCQTQHRECGPSGCEGESCGACPSASACDDDLGQCEPTGTEYAASGILHTLDGAYTGFGQDDAYEWSDVPPQASDDGGLCVDYQDGALHLIVERTTWTWLDARRALELEISGGNGTDLWRVVVDGGGGVTTIHNGQDCPDCAQAAVGIGLSPLDPNGPARAIVELTLLAPVGQVVVRVIGHSPGVATEVEDHVVAGTLGATLNIGMHTQLALVSGVSPQIVQTGDYVRCTGAGFGASSDTLQIGGADVTIANWGQNAILGRVTAVPAGGLVLGTGFQWETVSGVQTASDASELGPRLIMTRRGGDADGAFSDGEWATTVPLTGDDVRVGLAFDGLRLQVIADLPGGTQSPVVALTTADGRDSWSLSFGASGTLTVLRNGHACGCGVVGAAGDGATPWSGPGRRVAEVELEVRPGNFSVIVGALEGPKPVFGAGQLRTGGGLRLSSPSTPGLLGIIPSSGAVSDPVGVVGRGFGDAGAVSFGGVSATTSSWSSGEVTCSVPAGAVSGWCTVTPDGQSALPAIWFVVDGTDGDADGTNDALDACPADSDPDQADLDDDGVGDACDPDIDGDGQPNAFDDAPLVPGTDGDKDGDGVPDDEDAFPDDPDETADSDNDGVGDQGDVFPDDPNESVDSDKDGVGDNGDVFPDDPDESADSDKDGVGDNADCAPADPNTSAADCTEKVCGADGCGGSCGGCPGSMVCHQDFTCDFDLLQVPGSAYPHTVDGAFTDWPSDGSVAQHEWFDVPSAKGQYTFAYFDFDGSSLHVLNDWVFNDAAALNNGCYNLFSAYTGGGAEQWQVKVYADGTVSTWRNGEPYDGADGGYGWGPSPNLSDDHTIFEMTLPAAPGGFGVQLHDPGPTSGCEILVTEPTIFVGVNNVGGGLGRVSNTLTPWIVGVNPNRVAPGGICEVTGSAFGAGSGTVTVGGAPAQIISWANSRVVFVAPTGGGSGGLLITTASGVTTQEFVVTPLGPDDEPSVVINDVDSYPHTVDGNFTDWDAGSGDAHEWKDTVPASGKYTFAYFDYVGEHLYILNDWHVNDATAIQDSCYNLFKAWTGGGAEQWIVKVFGNGDVTVLKNGEAIDLQTAEGAVGFGPSPNVATPHTIFELKLPALPGGFGVQLHDPGPTFGCDVDPLLIEPANFQGDLESVGGTAVRPSRLPTLWSLLPRTAEVAQALTIEGAKFGESQGSVRFAGGVTGLVTSWSDTAIGVLVPKGAVTGDVTVLTTDGHTTNSLAFSVFDPWADALSCDGQGFPFFATQTGALSITLKQVQTNWDLRIQLELPSAGPDALGADLHALPTNTPMHLADVTAGDAISVTVTATDGPDSMGSWSSACAEDCVVQSLGDAGWQVSCELLGSPDFNDLVFTISPCAAGAACTLDMTWVPESGYPHTVDGGFTDWNAVGAPSTYEWHDVTAAAGQYTRAFFDYDGGRLHIMNDWHVNDAQALQEGCYNLFSAYTGDGAEQWQIKVFADGTVEGYKNGSQVDTSGPDIQGAYSFGLSPTGGASEHTMFELSLPAAPGGFGVQLHDPGPTSGCADLWTEPAVFIGVAYAGGGLSQIATTTAPWIIGLNPTVGSPGTVCEANGTALGEEPGIVSVGGVAAQVVFWSATRVLFFVPDGAAGGQVRITTALGLLTNVFAGLTLGPGTDAGAVVVIKDSYPHSVDGQFTDWSGAAQQYEWAGVTPATGQYTYALFDYDGEHLYILNDWHINDVAAVEPTCFNRFKVWTGGGAQVWDIKVFGSGTTEITLNGELVDLATSEGAVGFGPSPYEPDDHTIFELKFPASPGGFGVQFHDPGPSFDCLNDMLTEPTNFQGTLDPQGGLVVSPATKPTLWGLSLAVAKVGATLELSGSNLGEGGVVTFAGGTTGAVQSWSATSITVEVPNGALSGLVVVSVNGAATTNGLFFEVQPPTPGGELPITEGLVMHLDAKELALSDGATVAAWSDLTGGFDLSQTAEPNQPTFTVDGIGGGPGVFFDAAQADFLETAVDFPLTGDAAFTVFTVLQLEGAQAGFPVAWVWGNPSASGQGSALQLKSGNAFALATGFSQDAVTPVSSFTGYTSKPAIVTLAKSPGPIAANTAIAYNGTEQTVTGSSAIANYAPGKFSLGSWFGSQPITITVGAMLIYNRTLTLEERASVNCFLAARYGISADAACTAADSDGDGVADNVDCEPDNPAVQVCQVPSADLTDLNANAYSVWELFFDKVGNAYFAQYVSGTDAIIRVAPDGTQTTFPGISNWNMGFGATTPDGAILVGAYTANNQVALASAGGVFEPQFAVHPGCSGITISGYGLCGPGDLEWGYDGHFYFGNLNVPGDVARFIVGQDPEVVASTGGTDRVVAVATTVDERLWAAAGNRLYTVDKEAGTATELADLGQPIVSVDASLFHGELFAETTSQVIWRVDMATGAASQMTTVAGIGILTIGTDFQLYRVRAKVDGPSPVQIITIPGPVTTANCTEAVQVLDPEQQSVKACAAASTDTYCATDWGNTWHENPATDTCGELCAQLNLGCVAARQGDFSSCQAWSDNIYSCATPKSQIQGQPDLHCLCDRGVQQPYVADCAVAAALVSPTQAHVCTTALNSVQTDTMCIFEVPNAFIQDPAQDSCTELCGAAGMSCITARNTDWAACGDSVPNPGVDYACDQPVPGGAGTMCMCYRGQPPV